jgi:hypothetical protein
VRAHIRIIAGPAAGTTAELGDHERLVLGRGAGASLLVANDSGLSRAHVQIEVVPPRVMLRDLGSKHGTYVNGQRQVECQLFDGDHVQAGETVFSIAVAHDAIAATQLSHAGLAATLQPGGVRCACGALASELPEGDGVVFVCPACRERLVEQPALPRGYTFVRMLGRGAMGSVCLARRDSDGTELAIKQVLPRAAMSAEMRARFVREAAVQAKLDHPNIVRVFDLVEATPGSFSLVMEFVDGKGADSLIEDGRVVPPETVVEIARQALAGLAYAHARQIVHRDIKEANLMIANGVVKIADFGLAKNYQEAGASGMTGDGALGGTLPYMPKEQLLDFRYVKPPADIYALGATMYRLLTGAYPRDFRDGENAVLVALERPIVPIRHRRPLPDRLSEVVEKALAPEVSQRYATADEMLRALAKV